MSTASVPETCSLTIDNPIVQPFVSSSVGPHLPSVVGNVRRRANIHQGQALEKLAHAIEYLIDSGMVLVEEQSTAADSDALQILIQLNRNVFFECAPVVSATHRVKQWFMCYRR